MKRILHITYDLRDRKKEEKTKAVHNLINISKNGNEVKTIDVVRVPNYNEEKIEKTQNHVKMDVFGLPYGLFLVKHCGRVLKIIKENREYLNIRNTEIIHAHKLTFEGLIGFDIAKNNKASLWITLRQTDFMVMKFRPDLIKKYKEILIYSEKIFYLIPYMLKMLEQRLGSEFYKKHVENKLVFLPNIIERKMTLNDNTNFSTVEFVTILRMNKESVLRKNLKNLLKAFTEIDDVKLKIIGDGTYKYQVSKWINNYNLNSKVYLAGPVPNYEIDVHLKNSRAFLMPSFSESFGMVYAEALLNETPIMYSKNVLGFDGMFEGVGASVDPYSVAAIKEGIKDLIENEQYYRENIKRMKTEGAFDIFSSDYIKKTYFENLDQENKRLDNVKISV